MSSCSSRSRFRSAPGDGRIQNLSASGRINASGPFGGCSGLWLMFWTVPAGLVSSYIFSLQPGERVAVSGPYGDFHASDSDREMVLIGGGAGIAPLRAIVHDQLLGTASERRISLWYGARNASELVYASELQQLAAEHDNFTYQAALSAPEPDDDEGTA